MHRGENEPNAQVVAEMMKRHPSIGDTLQQYDCDRSAWASMLSLCGHPSPRGLAYATELAVKLAAADNKPRNASAWLCSAIKGKVHLLSLSDANYHVPHVAVLARVANQSIPKLSGRAPVRPLPGHGGVGLGKVGAGRVLTDSDSMIILPFN